MMALLGASSIDTASSGWEATQMINERHYDIILSDYNLDKGKDGQQVLEEARYTNRLKASSLFYYGHRRKCHGYGDGRTGIRAR